MNVAIVMPLATQQGGAEVTLQHLMREGRGLGVEWTVVFLEHGPMVEEFRDLGVAVTVVPAGRFRQVPRYLRTVARLRSIARRDRIDLFVSWMGKAHLYVGVAAAIAGVPSVWCQPGIPGAREPIDRLATVLPSRGVIVPSKAAGLAQASLRPRRKQRIVHPGIDLARFDPTVVPPKPDARRALGLPLDATLIGFVGRLQHSKGAHALIDAMPRVLEAHPGARCVIVGGRHDLEASYLDQLQEQVSALELERCAIFAGVQYDVPLWMQAMDVIVLPSAAEAFGIAVVEAMAMGKPVLAGNSSGPTEIITHGINGGLVPHDDPSAIAQSIVECLSRPDYAARLSAEARLRASEFTAQRYARDVIAALHELAGV